MRILVLLFMVLFTVNVFSQTFQKAIYKHANDINDERGITNRYLFSDSVGTSKWLHSISVEGQLHNNYIYRSGEKKFSIYENYFGGDSTNEALPKWNFLLIHSMVKKNLALSIGLNLNKVEFVGYNTDTMEYYFNYKIIGLPIRIVYVRNFDRIVTELYIMVSPALSINEYRYLKDNYGSVSFSTTNLGQFHLCSGYGLIVTYKFNDEIGVFLSAGSLFSVQPFRRPYPIGEHWVNYSSYNFGFGLKYYFN